MYKRSEGAIQEKSQLVKAKLKLILEREPPTLHDGQHMYLDYR